MPPRHYGCDKFIIGIVVLIVLCLLSIWFWGNRAETAPAAKHPMQTEQPSIRYTQQADTKRALLCGEIRFGTAGERTAYE